MRSPAGIERLGAKAFARNLRASLLPLPVAIVVTSTAPLTLCRGGATSSSSSTPRTTMGPAGRTGPSSRTRGDSSTSATATECSSTTESRGAWIPVSNRTAVRSLAIDSEGRVFVGAIAELGYLAPDPDGRLHYVSLADRVPLEDRDFSDIWRSYAHPDGVYFQSYERLFRWQDGEIRAWRHESPFSFGFSLRNALYLQEDHGPTLHPRAGPLDSCAGNDGLRGQSRGGSGPTGLESLRSRHTSQRPLSLHRLLARGATGGDSGARRIRVL